MILPKKTFEEANEDFVAAWKEECAAYDVFRAAEAALDAARYEYHRTALVARNLLAVRDEQSDHRNTFGIKNELRSEEVPS